MISEDLVKQRFVHDTISQGINLIYQTQENVVRTYLNTRSGRLLSSLQRRPFTIQESEGKHEYFIRIFPYLIFFPFSFSTPVLLSSQHFLSYQKSPVPYTSFDNFRSLDIINREILPQGGFLLWTILFSV